ncbi:MAG: Wzz/FepE/Etk N-terminal domain-containing protein [Acidobacteriota bacterium]|nr:Wzz/FepE/Etk N-terminal domain-containing protein [Acidobacteriota bacterium]
MNDSPVVVHDAADASGMPDAPARELPLFELLGVLSRRRRFILRVTVAITVVAAIIVFLLPAQYMAETVLLPPAQNSPVAGALMTQLGGGALASMAGASLGVKNPGEMVAALFRSRTVEDAVVDRFHLMDRYRETHRSGARLDLEKHAAVTLGLKDGLLRIEVRDTDPQMAAAIANGYVEEFRKLNASLAIGEAAQRRLFFEQQLADARDKLAAAEDAFKQTEQQTGVLQLDSQAKSLIEAASALRAQVVAKEVQIQGMKSFATEDNPELVTAREQLAALRAQLARLGGSDAEADSFVLPKGKVPEAGLEYARRYRDVKYHEAIYELLARQFEMAKLDEARQGAPVQVVDAAVPPDRKSSPHRAAVTLAAAVLALLASAAWCVLQHAFEKLLRAHSAGAR